MSTLLLALFNLRPGVEAAAYEAWARDVDQPTVGALPSIESFRVMRVTGKLGSDETAPYAYAELITVRDMAQFGLDVATPQMQAVAAEFNRLADVVFLTTEDIAPAP